MSQFLALNTSRHLHHARFYINSPVTCSKLVFVRCQTEPSRHTIMSCSHCLSSFPSRHARSLFSTIASNPSTSRHSFVFSSGNNPSQSLASGETLLRTGHLDQFLHHRRHFHLNNRVLYDKEPSSKVEQTVNALKEEALKKEEKASATQAASTNVQGSAPTKAPATSVVVEAPKRSIWKRVKDEIVHYYHGFRLLFIDIRIASRLVLKSMRGADLSRREYRQLTRTTADIFRLVPFSIFIIVPFMELLLPVFLHFFPGMLPSTFLSAKDKESKIKQQLKIKLDMTRFLQTTLDELALESKGESHSHAAKQFAEFFSKIHKSGQMVSNEDILKFSKLFEDEITLDSLSRPQLVALCRLLELKPMGPDNLLRFQLRMQLRSLRSDDRMIQKEGVSSLTVPELQQACRSRGMRALGVAEERLRTQLREWLELSLNEKIPPSLLLLSRVLYLPENLPAADQLKATIQSLPVGVGTEAKYKIGETEGKIDNKTRLEMIKQEEAAIKKEKEEAEKAKIEKEAAVPVALPSPTTDPEVIIDKAPVVLDKATEVVAKPEEQLSKNDLEDLEEALEQMEHDKKSLVLEKEELDDIKEEMADYKEDMAEFKAIRNISGKKDLHESKAARSLRKRLDKMVNKMDTVMGGLEKKKEKIQEKIEYLKTKDEKDEEIVSGGSEVEGSMKVHRDNLVNINELLTGIKKLQKVEDEDKIKRIIDVLDSMDVDHDGAVEVEHVVKVLELLGRENVNISSEQMKQVVKLLIQEEKEDDEDRKKKETEVKEGQVTKEGSEKEPGKEK